MRSRRLGIGVAVGAATIASAVFMGPNAFAAADGGPGHGPCGATHSAAGTGSLGTPWILRAKYDTAVPSGVVVAEQFQIQTAAPGQLWHVQLADNGVVFFDKVVQSTASGVAAMGTTPPVGTGDQVMSAVGTNLGDGESIDASVTLLPPPASGCGIPV
ncbi:hypothetical protein GCM10009839_23410 [Catenulispora yoronensis]|uniref:Uncharacterized protein n=1 Tax=Catenulispora yoronensis TaxID=450799 RepID=A0ABP5FFY2_9ACTN